MLFYAEQLTTEALNKTATAFGFDSKLNLEKFIMDFEILRQIKKKINCTLRGGMCMPFYLNGVKRLSIDIDVVTNMNLEEIKEIIEKMDLSEHNINFEEYSPKKQLNLPMIRYDIHYPSQVTGSQEIIYLDIFYEPNFPQLETNMINHDAQIFDLVIGEKIKMFDLGCLISDKLDTIAKRTIGYEEGKKANESTPKQIFDLGNLFEIANNDNLSKPITKFKEFSEYKATAYRNPSFEKITKSIIENMEGFVLLDNIASIVKHKQQYYREFSNQYLSNNPYTITRYIEDIFKIQLFCRYVQKYNSGIMSEEDAKKQFLNDMNELVRLKNLDAPDKSSEKETIKNAFPRGSFINKTIFTVVPVENVFLIYKIETLKHS